MKRQRRTKILIKDQSDLVSTLSGKIRKLCKVTEIQPPREGLVMIKVREQARKSLFYLGEVLVTEAKCLVNGFPGLGIVRGSNDRLARDLAVIDGAWQTGLAELKEWEQELIEAEEKIIRNEEADYAKIEKTKVNFQSMQEEDYLK